MAVEAVQIQANDSAKKKRHRSPNYPSVGLKEAIERTEAYVKVNNKAGALPEIAARAIGFSSAHGTAMSVLAALKKFGLMVEAEGRVAPTSRAIEIVSLPKTDERRLKAIREAAALPPLYAELIEQYKASGLPGDETLEGELRAYKGFSPNAAKEFLKGFRETLEFSGLSDLSVLASDSRADGRKEKPQIGDFVQWEHNGTLGFAEPKKLSGFSDDGEFAFVEGYKGGLPVSEIILADSPVERSPHSPLLATVGWQEPRRNMRPQGAAMRQDVYSLSEGEVVLSWPSPLSEDSIADLQAWLELIKGKIARAKAALEQGTKESS